MHKRHTIHHRHVSDSPPCSSKKRKVQEAGEKRIKINSDMKFSSLGVFFNKEAGLVTLSDTIDPEYRMSACFQEFKSIEEAQYCITTIRKFSMHSFMIRELHSHHQERTIAVESVTNFPTWVKNTLVKNILVDFSSKLHMVTRDILNGLRLMHASSIPHGNLAKGIGITAGGAVKFMMMKKVEEEEGISTGAQRDFKDFAALLRTVEEEFDEKREELRKTTSDPNEKKKLKNCCIDPCLSQLVVLMESIYSWKVRVAVYNHPLGYDSKKRIKYMKKLAFFVQENSLFAAYTDNLSFASLGDWAVKIRGTPLNFTYMKMKKDAKINARASLVRNIKINYDSVGNLPRFLRNCLTHPPVGLGDENTVESFYSKLFPTLYSDLHIAFFHMMVNEDPSGRKIGKFYEELM